jgi:hypothetical protein
MHKIIDINLIIQQRNNMESLGKAGNPNAPRNPNAAEGPKRSLLERLFGPRAVASGSNTQPQASRHTSAAQTSAKSPLSAGRVETPQLESTATEIKTFKEQFPQTTKVLIGLITRKGKLAENTDELHNMITCVNNSGSIGGRVLGKADAGRGLSDSLIALFLKQNNLESTESNKKSAKKWADNQLTLLGNSLLTDANITKNDFENAKKNNNSLDPFDNWQFKISSLAKAANLFYITIETSNQNSGKLKETETNKQNFGRLREIETLLRNNGACVEERGDNLYPRHYVLFGAVNKYQFRILD